MGANRRSDRITPACAGNRKSWIILHRKKQDHPRVCGEQDITTPKCSGIIPSPPRVRGTGEGAELFNKLGRITPACAGNSFAN